MRPLVLNIALVVISCIGALLIVETVLRYTSYSRLLPYEGISEGYYTPHSATGYDLSKNFPTSTHRFKDGSYPLWSNELGCFDTPYRKETPYIYLTGDSFAWGFTPFEYKWGSVIENFLGIRVVKCGVPGYGTRQELAKTKETLEKLENPSLIIVSYFSNDESDDAAFPNSLVHEGKLIKNLSGDPSLPFEELQKKLPQFAQWAESYCMWNEPKHPLLQRTKCFLRRNSITYVLFQDAVKNIIQEDLLRNIGIVNEPPPSIGKSQSDTSAHLQRLLEFSALARERNANLLFVFVPSREDTYGIEPPRTYDVQKKFLDAHGIQYFDPTDLFRRVAQATSAPLYWPQDLHFNPLGNRLFGLLAALKITESSKPLTTLLLEALNYEFSVSPHPTKEIVF